ncbi:hypothetical protein R1sor_007848 [Riccia sorocarpa]|uniref:Reverse transcriptase domain-containing protein n=1 Tax=Riccia sorocarpa TaxID=122646 RepID=A0ABD3HV53_9MARC
MRGVALLLREDVKIQQWGTDDEGRVVWARITLQQEDFMVASVYAPNETSDRICFWENLTLLLPGGKWVVAGDWNSVVSPSDSNSKSNRQSEEEASQFQMFCSTFELKDAREVARRKEGPRYTMAQMRHGKFCWSRLDRLYFSDLSVRKVVHYSQFCLSDHLPISATFDLQSSVGEEERPKRSAYFKADNLVVTENIGTLKEVWQKTEKKFQGCRAADRFLKCWEAIRKQIKTLQYEKCARLNLLPEKERQLQSLMDKEPNTLTGEEKSILGELMSEVRALQAWKHHRWRQTCRDKFLKEGDACTAFFFQKFKKRKARTNIKKLLGEEGQMLTSREDIKREVHRHYSSLYESHDRGPEGVAAARQLLANVDNKISREEKVLLDEVPTEKEITDSLHILPAGKSPGPDGISREVMTTLWPIVGKSFCEAVIDFWESGDLLPYFKDGLLFLLPKVEDPLTLAQWRPITLLNTIYKVIAKLIAARLAIVLPGRIQFEQQGFIKGRSTHNCILTFALVHEALKLERKQALFYTLDQEKAYDRIYHAFIWETMDSMGFSAQTIQRIAALQDGAETRILFGGDLLPAFQVHRGVRQGCPLSPLLFVLTTVPFIDSLKVENQANRVRPISLPGNCRISCTCLADDLAVYTEVDHWSSVNLFRLFEKMEGAAGCKVNRQKSKILLIGALKRPPDWMSRLGLQVVGKISARECWGGLGLLEIQDFQHALLIRTFFKGIQNPSQSIWLPILTSVFWKGFSGDIVQTFCLQEPPRNLKQCPLTNLLLEAWGRFMSLYRWHPAENKIGPAYNIRQCCFLTARKFLDVQEAGRVVGMIAAWAKENNIRSTPQLTTRLVSGNHPFTRDDDVFLFAMLRELQGATVLQVLPAMDLSDWTGHARNNLDLSQRASAVHMKLAMEKENAQADRFNMKWRAMWPVSEWRQVWKVFTLKGLGNKHKVFLWRVLTKAFFDGRKERLMGLPSSACEFCKHGEEDVHHIFLSCPRWEPFWQEIGARLQGWGEFLQLRRSGATIPQLFIWAANGSKPEAWFKTWMLATVWRTLWAERCTHKYQGKCNNLHFLKLAYTMLEELAAKRDNIRKDYLQLALRRLLITLPVIPKRYSELFNLGQAMLD